MVKFRVGVKGVIGGVMGVRLRLRIGVLGVIPVTLLKEGYGHTYGQI
jgi:hypothetical protein